MKSPRAGDETLFEGRHLVLRRRGAWEYVERKGALPGVMVVALTRRGRLLLVEEPRPPVRRNVISLPAGLVGDEDSGETALVAAKRELLEETGYAARDLEPLGGGPTSPGLSSETITFYLARDADRVAEPSGEEQTTVHAVDYSKLESWARARVRQGRLIHPMLWAGVYLAGLSCEGRGGGGRGTPLARFSRQRKKEKR